MASEPSPSSSASPPLPSTEELLFKRKNLPAKPGCYIYKSKTLEVLYVGKAKSLKHRVNSYWQERSKSEDPYYRNKIKQLVAKIRDIEVFIVENEMESLILENELIKEHQPPYNVRLRDSKSYPWVQITNDKFPRIRVIRIPKNYGLHHKYIGPFIDTKELRVMLRFLRKIFPYCTCKRPCEKQNRKRPCVYHQIKLCPAPCTGKITRKEYLQNIFHIEQLLMGNIDPVSKNLQEKMDEASASLKFEQAAMWRDRLRALEKFAQDQSILAYNIDESSEKNEKDSESNLKDQSLDMPKTPLWKDLDVVAGSFSKKRGGLILLHVRRGRLLKKTPYILDLKDEVTSKQHFFLTLLKQHYLQPNIPLPEEIVLGTEIQEADQKALIDYFYKEEHIIQFRPASEKDKTAGLLRIAQKNIKLLIRQKDEYETYLADQDKIYPPSEIEAGLQKLQELLELDTIPEIIEGYDMSHSQGADYVGSKVALEHGKPAKSLYRRFKIRDPTITGSDDIKAMKEVMSRRYKRAIQDEEEFPDLIVVDGGKAQLNMAHKLLVQMGLQDISHIGISKPPGRSEVYNQPKLIIPGKSEPIILAKGDPGLKILQLLRDESHRFAISYHRKLQQKRQSKSIIDNIPGIGPARKNKILSTFKSVKQIRAATKEEICTVLGEKIGSQVFEYLKKHPDPKPSSKKSTTKRYKLKRKTKPSKDPK